MCSAKTKKRVHNFNRYVIALLTFIGMMEDGLQFSDCIASIALIQWLWLPEVDRIEELILEKLSVVRAGVLG